MTQVWRKIGGTVLFKQSAIRSRLYIALALYLIAGLQMLFVRNQLLANWVYPVGLGLVLVITIGIRPAIGRLLILGFATVFAIGQAIEPLQGSAVSLLLTGWALAILAGSFDEDSSNLASRVDTVAEPRVELSCDESLHLGQKLFRWHAVDPNGHPADCIVKVFDSDGIELGRRRFHSAKKAHRVASNVRVALTTSDPSAVVVQYRLTERSSPDL